MTMSVTSSAQGARASFAAQEILQATKPVEVIGEMPSHPLSISWDTRSLQAGDIYLALQGENFDGHKFVADAIKGGASACIVGKTLDQLSLDAALVAKSVIIRVDDTLDAFHAVAKFWRRKIDPIVVSVTGSSGKTTTKEMCSAVLGKSRRTHKSHANENNEIGVPKTILSMPEDCQVLVLEMAMRGAGQIAQLARTALSDIGIITCCGTAHMELLGSLENIIKAKCELFEYMDPAAATAIIGAPSDGLRRRAKEVYSGRTLWFDAANVEEIEVEPETTKFRVMDIGSDFVVYAHGINHIQDAWCAVMMGKEAGLSHEEIAAGLLTYRSPEGRGQRKLASTGAVIIDESYNANPESMRCAVDSVLDKRAFPQSNKYIVLGEMAELGSNDLQMHFELGKWLKDKSIVSLITIGEKAASIADGAAGSKFRIVRCGDQNEALAILQGELDADSCVMVKGSHCAGLETLVAKLEGAQ